MKKLSIVLFGKIKSDPIDELISKYQKLTSKYIEIDIVVKKDVGETKIALQDFDHTGFLVAVDVSGKGFGTVEFSDHLNKIMIDQQNITFVIGNAYGLQKEVINQADLVLSLSRLTFTHELAVVILLEQLYRVLNFKQGGKYHKL